MSARVLPKPERAPRAAPTGHRTRPASTHSQADIVKTALYPSTAPIAQRAELRTANLVYRRADVFERYVRVALQSTQLGARTVTRPAVFARFITISGAAAAVRGIAASA